MISPQKMSRGAKVAVTASLVCAVLGGSLLGFQKMTMTALPELDRGVVEIKKGWGMARIAQEIFSTSRLHRGCFKIYALVSGSSRRLKAGEYQLEKDSIRSVTEKLVSGKILQYRVTVAEGTWSDDIATLLASADLGDREKFRTLIHNPAFARSLLGYDVPGLEGYLFPETYFFTRGMAEEDILKVFVARFHDKTRPFFQSDTNMSTHEAMTLASIVEREAARNEERPLISAVFLNRLKKRMPLESCVTVEYALGMKKKQLTDEDLRVDSPYNTYRHMGLPPGPVGNPGLAAIRAVLLPDSTADLFFVARGDGGHVFSKTWAAHKEAKRKIRIALRKQKMREKK